MRVSLQTFMIFCARDPGSIIDSHRSQWLSDAAGASQHSPARTMHSGRRRVASSTMVSTPRWGQLSLANVLHGLQWLGTVCGHEMMLAYFSTVARVLAF